MGIFRNCSGKIRWETHLLFYLGNQLDLRFHLWSVGCPLRLFTPTMNRCYFTCLRRFFRSLSHYKAFLRLSVNILLIVKKTDRWRRRWPWHLDDQFLYQLKETDSITNYSNNNLNSLLFLLLSNKQWLACTPVENTTPVLIFCCPLTSYVGCSVDISSMGNCSKILLQN